jgi:nucleotidyltransferase/DNA polymerase involved in DNA repair
MKARRRAQRARTNILRSKYSKVYKIIRKQLKIAIRTSKREKFKELCKEVDTNPWGLGYKNAIAKLKGQSFRKEKCPNGI